MLSGRFICCLGLALPIARGVTADGAPAWPEATRDSKPWVYNWWMGSAVDEDGLEAQCAALAEKGFGGFHVIPIYGPKMPPLRTMSVLSSWSKAEDGADEPFCGTIRYRAEFSVDEGIEESSSAIDLGKVCHSARVWINGHNLGCRFVPPYRFDVPKGVLKDVNEIEVEVTNLGANRIRWSDLNGVNWKYFRDVNMISVKGVWAGGLVPFDASGWQLRESGLLGPVSLLVY